MKQGKWTHCYFVDYTCVCILENFKNEVAARSMEKLMKKVSEKKASEIIKASGFWGTVKRRWERETWFFNIHVF